MNVIEPIVTSFGWLIIRQSISYFSVNMNSVNDSNNKSYCTSATARSVLTSALCEFNYELVRRICLRCTFLVLVLQAGFATRLGTAFCAGAGRRPGPRPRSPAQSTSEEYSETVSQPTRQWWDTTDPVLTSYYEWFVQVSVKITSMLKNLQKEERGRKYIKIIM
jgi:hypothetical protein